MQMNLSAIDRRICDAWCPKAPASLKFRYANRTAETSRACVAVCIEICSAVSHNTWVRQAHNGQPAFHGLLLVRHTYSRCFTFRSCLAIYW